MFEVKDGKVVRKDGFEYELEDFVKQASDWFKDSLKLECLDNAGVDNWDWYGDAMQDYKAQLAEVEKR